VYLDDYPLRSIEVQHEPSDIRFVEAKRNRKNTCKVFLVMTVLWLVCIIVALIEKQGERTGLIWAMLAISILSLVFTFRESRSFTQMRSSRSVKIGIMSLLDSYQFSGMNTIELRYPFKQMQGIAVRKRHIVVTMSRNGILEIPVDMFVSESDMKGFAQALSEVARCELSAGDSHAF